MSTILIIDDHPAMRLVIRAQLEQLVGIQHIYEADNGQSAVEMARQHTPDLAILDLDIPRINGFDVIPRLKLAHPGIRMLIVSGHDPATFSPRTMRLGAHGFIGKTNEIKQIVRGVEAVLAGYTVFPVQMDSGPSAALTVGEVADETRLATLSDKELVILQMLARGMSNKEIGEALFISEKTVSTYKTRLQQKLGLRSLAALIEFATRHKLVD